MRKIELMLSLSLVLVFNIVQAETISRWGSLDSLEENSTLVDRPIRNALNRAGYFNGTYQFAKIANSVDINTGFSYPNRTISVWFQCDDITKTDKQVIYEEGGGSNGFNIYIQQGILYIGGWAGNAWSGTWHNSRSIESGVWHHASLVLSSSHTFTAYLDGVSIGSTPFAAALPKHGGDINIARNGKTKFHDNLNNAGPNSFFGGRIDEFRIWNEARSLESIQKEMHRELLDPYMEYDLVCNLRFNQSEGSQIEDFSWSNNPGLLNSSSYISWQSSTAPIPFFSANNGYWNSNSSWANGQNSPQNSWARVDIHHDIALRNDVICEELYIQDGASLHVYPLHALTVNGDLNNNAGTAGLVLKSNASGASSLIHYRRGVQAEVESFYDLGQHYLIAAPINNAQSNIFLNQYMFSWDESLYEWQNFSEINVDLETCKGFDLYNINQQIATYSGVLNNGNLGMPGLTYTETGLGDPGFNLVGNPYPSVLDIRNVVFPEEVFFFFMVPTIVAASHVLNSNTETYYTYSQGTNGGDVEARYIQPGQGFFVEVSDWAPFFGPPTWSVTNAARTHTGLGSIDKAVDQEMNHEVLKISISDENLSNVCYIAFRDSARLGFDGKYDASLLMGNTLVPYVYSFFPSDSASKLSINAFPFNEDNTHVKIGLDLPVEGDYTLSFSQLDKFNEEQKFFLHDKLTNSVFDIREKQELIFTYTQSQDTNRFDLYFQELTKIPEKEQREKMIVYTQNKNIFIGSSFSLQEDSELWFYNVLGQEMGSCHLGQLKMGLAVDWPAAYYIIKVKDKDEILTQKFYLK